MSSISRRVLLRRNATRDPEHSRIVVARVERRGMSENAGQQNYQGKREEEREDERRREGMRKMRRERWERRESEKGDPLYNPRNTGCAVRDIYIQRTKTRVYARPLITA